MMLFKKPSTNFAILKYCIIVPIFIGITVISSLTFAKKSDSIELVEPVSEKVISFSNPQLKITSEPSDIAYIKMSKDTLIKSNAENKETIFTAAEQNPEFPGGMPAMYRFLGNNIKYPNEAQKNKVQGRVFVRFIVEKDGSIGRVEVLKGIGFGCDEEAIRVVKSMPKWIPGRQSGKNVRVYYRMPIIFKIDDSGFRKKRGFLIPNFEKNKGLGFFKTNEKINWKSKREVYLSSYNSHTHKTLISNDKNFYGSRVELNPANVVESQNAKQVIGSLVF